MQVELVPELTPPSSYETLVIAMNVFSRCLFAYPTSSQEPKTNAKSIIKIITNYSYLPTAINSNKDSVFVSQVIEKESESIRRG